MLFDWKEFLELAKALRNSAGSGYSVEAANRTAVSRAYYAAFCWTRNYAESHWGFQRTKSGLDHRLLREHLRKLGKTKAASRLERLHQWRKKCDYEDHVAGLVFLVENAIKTTIKIIQECR